ncbi:MAG: DNA polymerase IV [candidate division KSB1 bacterium]|nr:DNA polymerase IV [candidate division KSB1 bacterium]
MGRIIFHIDMDAFFAAIEELDNPNLRGKPVVVGADPKGGKGRGVVSTANYEARKYGIRSAMPISEAYRRCPHAVFLPVRGERYHEVSRQIMALLKQYTPLLEPVSIDEAYLDMTHSPRLFGPPEQVAREIKKRIREVTGGLTASVGVAPNKFLAKVASDLQKPDGLVVVPEDRIEEFLWPLPVGRLWGVGERTEPILESLGLRTIGDVARTSPEELVRRFGSWGYQLWELAHGRDNRPVVPTWKAKSISQETTFERDIDDEEAMVQTLLYLADGVTRQLRDEGLRGRTITVKIRLEDFSTFTRSQSLEVPTDRFADVSRVVLDLFRRFDRRGQRVRLLGVGVSNFEREHRQLTFLDQLEESRDRVDEIIDLVRRKFGESSIQRGITAGRGKRKGKAPG